METESTDRVYVSGSNDAGQLGLGEEMIDDEISQLTLIPKLKNIKFKLIASGQLHNIAVDNQNMVYTWGCNDEWALGREGDELLPNLVLVPSHNIIKVSAGDSISAILYENGEIYAWGTFRSSCGVLGFLPDVKYQKEPFLVNIKDNNDKIIDLTCGSNHIVAISQKGKIYTWGNGERGILGRLMHEKNLKKGLFPTLIYRKKRKTHLHPISSYCGFSHTIIMNQGGKLTSFGFNGYGQLGIPDTLELNIPKLINFPYKVKNVSSGENHVLVLTENGEIYAWGSNSHSQLAIDNIKTLKIYSPQKISTVNWKPIQIFAGSRNSMAISSNGKVYGWGSNESGQLALSTDSVETQILPAKINDNFNASYIAIGCSHALILGHFKPINNEGSKKRRKVR